MQFERPVSSSYEGRDLEVLSGLKNYYDWIYGIFRPFVSGRVAELGAGTGTFSRLIEPDSHHLDLVEPSEHLVPELRAKFAGRGPVSIHHTSLEQFIGDAPAESFDTLVLVNVLEHVESDHEAVAEFCRALRPGGHLLVFVPALPGLYSPLDRSLGHYRRYVAQDLGELVQRNGFECVKLRYFDALGILPWWLMNRVLGAKGFNPAMVWLYDRLFVPPGKLLEGIVPPPWGKNLVLVARKPV